MIRIRSGRIIYNSSSASEPASCLLTAQLNSSGYEKIAVLRSEHIFFFLVLQCLDLFLPFFLSLSFPQFCTRCSAFRFARTVMYANTYDINSYSSIQFAFGQTPFFLCDASAKAGHAKVVDGDSCCMCDYSIMNTVTVCTELAEPSCPHYWGGTPASFTNTSHTRSWGFHIVRTGIVPGYFRFRPRFAGVVDIWIFFQFRGGTYGL